MRTRLKVTLALALIAAWPIAARQRQPGPEARLQAAITKESVEGDLKSAIEMYRKLADEGDRVVAAKALVRMGACYERLGDAEARKAYERVVTQFADQKDAVAEARRRLSAKGTANHANEGIVERVAWSFPDSLEGGGLSADGRFISAIYWDANRVLLHDLVTGDDRTIEEKTKCGDAVVSPDGSQIACPWRDASGRRGLRLIRTDGSATRALISGEEPFPSDWSRDGKSLVARVQRQSTTPGPWHMVVVSIADGSMRVLKSGDGVGSPQTPPRISPDGRYIVHSANRKSVDGTPAVITIHAMSVDGSGDTPLVEGPPAEKDWGAVWTPDGQRIVFLSDRSGATAIWSVRVRDGKPLAEPELVKADAGDLTLMGFGRNGALYGVRWVAQSDVYVTEFDPETARALSDSRRINQTYVGRSNGPLAWSPDGRWLAFTRSAGSRTMVVVHSTETGEEHELPQSSSQIVAWSPDGQSLLTGDPLKWVDVKSGQTVPVTNLEKAKASAYGRGIAASRDGKTFYYVYSERDNRPNDEQHVVRLVRHQVDTGAVKEVYRTRAPLYFLALSPDERWIAFCEAQEQGVAAKVVSIDGGEAREISAKTAGGTAWSQDSRFVLFRGMREAEVQVQLFTAPASGGEARATGIPTLWVHIAMNPDGRRLAHVEGSAASKVVALENLLVAPKIRR